MTTLEISHPITVEDLESFPDELRLELHEGVLHVRPPEDAWHSDMTFQIASHLRIAGMQAFQGMCIKFGESDTRVPDVAVFKAKPDLSKAYFPPSDFLIVVEVVSKATEDQDRILKPLHYARAGIPEFWRVECDADDGRDVVIHQHKLSADGQYGFASVTPR